MDTSETNDDVEEIIHLAQSEFQVRNLQGDHCVLLVLHVLRSICLDTTF